MTLNKYNNLLTLGRWYNKDPKDVQNLDLFGVSQKITDYSKKSSDKSNRGSTKVESSYLMDLTPWILEEPKRGVGKKTKHGK